LGTSLPSQATMANSSTASTQLAAGPAATMAARWRSGRWLKACARSCGATMPSRSSSMRT
jgi:hypothetical protein